MDPLLPRSFTLLQVVPALDGGGVESLTVATAATAARAGARSLVASHGGLLETALAASGGELLRIPIHARDPLRMLANAIRLAGVIRRENVSLVHVRSRAPAFSVLAAARLADRGTPVVTSYQGAYSARGPLKRWYNRVMTAGVAVIANSEFTAAHIRDQHPRAADRIVVIPEGIDTAQFDPAAVSAERVTVSRAKFGPAAGRQVVLVPARITAGKGHAVIVDAVAASPCRESVALVFAGPGENSPLAAALRARASEAGVALTLTGPLADMPAALAAADFVAAPSTVAETFGRGAAEAMAMERVLLASAVGGQAETAQDGLSARLIPAGDVAAWTAALTEALAMSGAERSAMGSAGRDRILARFSLEAMCAATFALYTRLAAGTRLGE